MRLHVTCCITLGLVAIVAMAGCTSETPGQAQPSSTGDTTTSAAPNRAPTVARPLDATTLVNEPCLALTAVNLAGLNITNSINGGTHHDAGGSACTWTGESGAGISIGWVTANTGGLSDLYVKASTMSYWQPTTVDGYPAAYGDAISDGRAQGDCVINVAVTDHLYFGSQFDDPSNADQSCALAEQAAADVVKNLGGS